MQEKVTIILPQPFKKKLSVNPGLSIITILTRLRTKYELSRSIKIYHNGYFLKSVTYDSFVTKSGDVLRITNNNRAGLIRSTRKILSYLGTLVKLLIAKNKKIFRLIITTIARLNQRLLLLILSKQNYFLKIITQPINKIDMWRVLKQNLELNLKDICVQMDTDKTITVRSEDHYEVSLNNVIDLEINDGSIFDNFINRSNNFYEAFEDSD
jgi:hypothetical protein